jgi:hypothetical protein
MRSKLVCAIICVFLSLRFCIAQRADSTILSADEQLEKLVHLSGKYLQATNKKVAQYNEAVYGRMTKTLTRLTKWETKIKRILDRTDPATSARLFGSNQLTFSSLLEKLKHTKSLSDQYTGKFNHYTDKLKGRLDYIGEQKAKLEASTKAQLRSADSALTVLNNASDQAEYLDEFIKERRQQLVQEALKHVGKTRYFKKLNKESYYYTDALTNYKAVLADPKKTEQLVASVLSKIPAFKQFAAQHSQLAGVFAPLGVFGGASGSSPIVNGLASRADVQNALSATGADASSLLSHLQSQPPVNPASLDQLKDKLPLGSKQGEQEIPGFTPNSQRNKTFRQRLEVGSDFQFGKANQLLPTTATTGLTLGYKINDKSSAGIGVNYLLGLGNGWQNIRLTSEGIGFRSYVKWKFKGNFYLQAGGEWNYMMRFGGVEELKKARNWQQATLIGLSKQYMISKKVKGNVQLLYNLLHYQNQPRTQPLVIRLGYGL